MGVKRPYAVRCRSAAASRRRTPHDAPFAPGPRRGRGDSPQPLRTHPAHSPAGHPGHSIDSPALHSHQRGRPEHLPDGPPPRARPLRPAPPSPPGPPRPPPPRVRTRPAHVPPGVPRPSGPARLRLAAPRHGPHGEAADPGPARSPDDARPERLDDPRLARRHGSRRLVRGRPGLRRRPDRPGLERPALPPAREVGQVRGRTRGRRPDTPSDGDGGGHRRPAGEGAEHDRGWAAEPRTGRTAVASHRRERGPRDHISFTAVRNHFHIRRVRIYMQLPPSHPVPRARPR